MDIKTIRHYTNLTQKEFAAKYGIPLQTLKQWESDPGSSCHRKAPDYVINMLGKLVVLESVKGEETLL